MSEAGTKHSLVNFGMTVGFTGTQRGMSALQTESFMQFMVHLLVGYGGIEFHHGNCIGADAEAHGIFHDIVLADKNSTDSTIVIHPSIKKDKQSQLTRVNRYNMIPVEVRDPLDYLERNRMIVNESSILIACPYELTETQRSGTWSTYRYAKSLNRPRVIIDRNGIRTEEGF
jgi:hypothetical protein